MGLALLPLRLLYRIVAEENKNSGFDEQPLAKLLEAAYVLQEQNRELKKRELNLELQRMQYQSEELNPKPRQGSGASEPADYTLTLAQIVQTQHQIQSTQLNLADAMALVAKRVVEIARADGASIGILDGKDVQYRATAGSMSLPLNTEIPMEKALCVASLRTGQVVRCTNVNSEFLLDVEECHRRGIESMVAVPIYQDEAIEGGLELYYSKSEAFTEQDVHTCQLMAGLVTEALARDQEKRSKNSMASDRALMLETLEKIRPDLEALVGTQQPNSPGARASASDSVGLYICRKCSNEMMAGEQFCGSCGTPRSSDYEPANMQSKVASLWQMQESADTDQDVQAAPDVVTYPQERPLSELIEEELPELFAGAKSQDVSSAEDSSDFHAKFDDFLKPVRTETPDLDPTEQKQPAEEIIEEPSEIVSATALTQKIQPWSSAVSARDFLEQMAPDYPSPLTGFWKARRGDVYLAIAVLLVAVVIRFGIWSSGPVSATAGPNSPGVHHKVDPTADLSWFDRLLVNVGVAEPPPVQEYKGNPDTQVWVDLHTALYYCPGADLYGKTPKGKFTSQKDAQLDQFEPAYRKSCD